MAAYTQYIWVLWDLAAVAVLALLVWGGAARGFVRTVIRVAGYAGALVVAKIGSPVLAQALYEHVVRDALRVVLTGRLEDLVAGGGVQAGEIVEQIPGGLRRIMTADAGAIANKALEAADTEIVEMLIDAALREPVLSILQGIIFLLLFTVVMMLVRNLTYWTGGVNRLPLLGTANMLLGGVVGVLQGALALVVVALSAQLLILFTGGGYFWMNPSVIDDTYIFRVFYNFITL